MNDGAQVPSDPVGLIDLLKRLTEPPQPPPIPMMPQTAGWLVLAALLLFLIAWAVYVAVCHRKANAYRRAALAELGTAGDDPAAIAAILRRAALAAWPREEVASLTGEAWLAFLDRTGGDGRFSEGPGKAILSAPYRPAPGVPANGLSTLAGHWIRRHRVTAAKAGP
ncbi:DUF4381 domain-containing protein [Microbaculum marinisediminis]|uniref:DUF4381 domain-containing protein n=1 Tax=Microbaculum marinisediminis TaxID=2931392 RepID=A0AAW5R2U9_9HYPH|nr:DUF4381 domain-containing protein [Microbaculum sp. A6E488]MCT8974298.1 DUF4381 domain-containing protein [Microbaculum sp. A6E488]